MGFHFPKQGQYLAMSWQFPFLTQIILMMKSVSSRLDGQAAAGYWLYLTLTEATESELSAPVN